MKKRSLLKSVLAVGLAATILAGCGNNAKQEATDKTTIKVATSGTTNPYTTIGDDGENTGYDIDVLKAVLKKLPQYNLEFVTTDFASMFEGTLSGSYDIAVNNFSYSEKRSDRKSVV